jgi:hypothetical protein
MVQGISSAKPTIKTLEPIAAQHRRVVSVQPDGGGQKKLVLSEVGVMQLLNATRKPGVAALAQALGLEVQASQERMELEVIPPEESNDGTIFVGTGEMFKPEDMRPFYFGEYVLNAIRRGKEWWFIAADVCRPLDIHNVSQAVSRLDDDERDTAGIYNSDMPNGFMTIVIVSESGLYELIMTSRKPEAKAFKRWVKREVLPTLRETGTYTVQPQRPKTSLELGNVSQAVGRLYDDEKGICTIDTLGAQEVLIVRRSSTASRFFAYWTHLRCWVS